MMVAGATLLLVSIALAGGVNGADECWRQALVALVLCESQREALPVMVEGLPHASHGMIVLALTLQLARIMASCTRAAKGSIWSSSCAMRAREHALRACKRVTLPKHGTLHMTRGCGPTDARYVLAAEI